MAIPPDDTNGHVTLVREMYAAFSRGDITSVLSRLSPDVTWREPENPLNPAAGTWRGHAGVEAWLRAGHEAEDIVSLEPREFIAQRNRVAVIGHSICRVRRTGRTYETDFVHLVTIHHDRIAAFQEFFDTYAAAEAFKDQPTSEAAPSRRALALAGTGGGVSR